MHAFGPGFGFPFFLFAPLLWIVVIVVVALLLRRGARRRWEATGGPSFGPHRSPESTLSERFANGEIDEVEYRSRLEVLRANRPVKR
jgi:putative membrane protein